MRGFLVRSMMSVNYRRRLAMDKLTEQVKKNMVAKQTPELLKILDEDEREQYSRETLAIVRTILAERGESIPFVQADDDEVVASPDDWVHVDRPSPRSGHRVRRISFGLQCTAYLIAIIFLVARGYQEYSWTDQLLGILVVIGLFSVTIGRLHDVNRSGWWSLFLLVLPFSIFLVIYLLFRSGTIGANTYGPDCRNA